MVNDCRLLGMFALHNRCDGTKSPAEKNANFKKGSVEKSAFEKSAA